MLAGGTAEGPSWAKENLEFSGSQKRNAGTQGYFIPELNPLVALQGCSMQSNRALHRFLF